MVLMDVQMKAHGAKEGWHSPGVGPYFPVLLV